MTSTFWKRIQPLESKLQTHVVPQVFFRYGALKHLPDDILGERHLVVSKSEPTALPNVERCEFEEQVGPAPASDELSFDVYLSLEDEIETPL